MLEAVTIDKEAFTIDTCTMHTISLGMRDAADFFAATFAQFKAARSYFAGLACRNIVVQF